MHFKVFSQDEVLKNLILPTKITFLIQIFLSYQIDIWIWGIQWSAILSLGTAFYSMLSDVPIWQYNCKLLQLILTEKGSHREAFWWGISIAPECSWLWLDVSVKYVTWKIPFSCRYCCLNEKMDPLFPFFPL